MKKRATIALILSCVVLVGVAARLYRLVSDDKFLLAGDRQSSHTISVARVRGTIYDTHMRPLVNNGYENRYGVFPGAETNAVLTKSLPHEELTEILSLMTGDKPFLLRSDTLLPLSTGIRAFSVPVRYTEDDVASHLIGYLDGDGLNGVAGAECIFNDCLTAATGEASVTYTVDGAGSWLAGGQVQRRDTLYKADAGVVLTIDRDVQVIAERIADASLEKGAIVVMSPKSGDILAMVSRPDFDRSSLAAYLSRDDAPLVNRALSRYNCGSVFKIVSSIAALESGMSIKTTYTCTGSIDVYGVTFRCHQRLGHGKLDLFGGFAESCNPYYISLIEQVGANGLYQMADALGFADPIAIAPGWQTASANLPHPDMLRQPAALANLSFGQGKLLATPVHIAGLIGTVINDGHLVTPTVFKGYVDDQGHVEQAMREHGEPVFSTETAITLKQMMIEVVENGLGTGAKPQVGSAGGKTGTAQTGMIGANGEELLQNWFAGFYPAVSPQYVVVVLSEDYDSTGDRAAPVFRDLCNALQKLA